MNLSPSHPPAERLASAAGGLRRSLHGPQALRTLPHTLAHLDTAIDELATSMIRLAGLVAQSEDQPASSLDLDHLSPEARALCWHLHEFAARLRAARAAGATARQWADDLPPAGAPRWGAVEPKVHA